MDKVREITLETATLNKIYETVNKGNIGYVRDIVVPIPIEAIEEDVNVAEYIRKMGEISRMEDLEMDVALEEETVGGVKLLSVVITPNPETDVDRIRELLK